MTVSKQIYRHRKINNLCTICGKNAEFNKTLCLYHLEKANKNQQAVYTRRKNNKQCPLCGEKLVNNRKVCNKCLDKQVSKHRDEVWVPFKDRKRHGLCLDCRKDNSTSNLYCDQCAKKRIDNQTSIRQSNLTKGLCGVCGKRLLAIGKKRCIICIHKNNKWYSISSTRIKNMERTKVIKRQIMEGYGNQCNCCAETEITFLAIDHVFGKGNAHRKKIKKLSGIAFYRWIISQNFPNDLQILCYNCNMSKYLLGECAHKKKK